MSAPLVSIVVPAYNAMPYLTRSIESALAQTIGHDDLEVIVVDDGSTDDTGDEADRFAAAHPKVVRSVHQPNSGGPGAPRNTALDVATGKYVFFLDADDYLGPEAIERMVATAEENGSDVVLGRMVGVDGRRVPRAMFKKSRGKVSLYASKVYWTLSPLKLFRRELIENLGLRFPVGAAFGEDQPFVAKAYINARVISVVADYDCYYATKRPDRNGVTFKTARESGVASRLESLLRMFTLLKAELPAGRDRDLLLRRHMEKGLQGLLWHMSKEPDPQVRQHAFDAVAPTVVAWSKSRVALGMPADLRRQFALIEAGELEAVLSHVVTRTRRAATW
ncbi:MAG TPA: glycosyltransferase family A protein, partial [Phytomonospora sp.]